MHEILLAEDIPAYMDRIISILGVLPVRVTGAYDGLEAINFVEDADHPIDLLLTDMDMPKHTGWQVIEAFRSQRGDLPIIMQTGEAAYDWVKDKAAELGIVLIDKIHVDLRLVESVRELLRIED